jgi:hypothetical protein
MRGASWERRPAEGFSHRLVRAAEGVQDLHSGVGEAALRELLGALHKQHDPVLRRELVDRLLEVVREHRRHSHRRCEQGERGGPTQLSRGQYGLPARRVCTGCCVLLPVANRLNLVQPLAGGGQRGQQRGNVASEGITP